MFKNIGQRQHFGYLMRDEITSNAFEESAYKKLIYFIIYILSISLKAYQINLVIDLRNADYSQTLEIQMNLVKSDPQGG